MATAETPFSKPSPFAPSSRPPDFCALHPHYFANHAAPLDQVCPFIGMESVARTCIDEPAAGSYIRRAQTLLNRILPAVKAPREEMGKMVRAAHSNAPAHSEGGPAYQPSAKRLTCFAAASQLRHSARGKSACCL